MRRLPLLDVQVAAAVVHAESIAVLEERVVRRSVAFPRLIAGDDDLLRLGPMHSQLGAMELCDQIVIDEWLAPRANLAHGTAGGCRLFPGSVFRRKCGLQSGQKDARRSFTSRLIPGLLRLDASCGLLAAEHPARQHEQ